MNISSNPFHVGNSNQNEKKIGPLCLVCHGLPENAFQVNQLYNVTWSNKYLRYVFTIQSIQDTYSQILIIAQTLKALDLLLKQSLLGIVVFYTHKTPKRGEHS